VESRRVVAGQPLELSPREWLLLELLLQHRGRVVTRADPAVLGPGRQRQQRDRGLHPPPAQEAGGSGLAVRTVRGLGYLLEASP
jgi:two-component system OmpR family response regulator